MRSVLICSRHTPCAVAEQPKCVAFRAPVAAHGVCLLQLAAKLGHYQTMRRGGGAMGFDRTLASMVIGQIAALASPYHRHSNLRAA
jgi:hypothetical protein